MIGWQRVTKIANPALDGNYQTLEVKDHIRIEAHNRCVYCGIHENFVGGYRVFHRDHYKPKARFVNLTHKLSNLYYACPFCNIFKSDEWPNDPKSDHSVAAFPDPAEVDYGDLFSVNWNNGVIRGSYPDSIYIESQLHLNRPQLIMTRQEHNLCRRKNIISEKSITSTHKLLDVGSEEAKTLISAQQAALHHLQIIIDKGNVIPRYESGDTR